MSNQVYANSMEVSCKQAAGKSICAFPDVCMTPPQTPATPPGVPIPYPNTGMASDTSDGSSSVKISGQEVMLKNKSCFKKSSGDEAGSAPMKNVVTHKTAGKVYFTAWSMDVKIEGENAVRMMDMTTHNHASLPGGTPPWQYIDEAASPGIAEKCSKDKEKEEAACSDDQGKYKSARQCCDDAECQQARNCMLVPYGGPGSPNCCHYEDESKNKTGHHLLPNSLLQGKRNDSSTNVDGLQKTGTKAYTCDDGACVCVVGEGNADGVHGDLHELTKAKLRAILEAGEDLTYEKAKSACAQAHNETFRNGDGTPRCEQACIEAQIDASLHKHKTTPNAEIKVRQKDGATRKNFDRYKDGDKDV